jgi:Cytochrome c oxidase subunit IV
MKVSSRMFGFVALFLIADAILYWYCSHDPTGTAALVMAFGMCGMIFFYLGFTNKRLGAGPDDRNDAEPYEGSGEQGFFSPHSWWPFVLAGAGAFLFLGIAVGFWLVYFAAPLVAFGVYGLIFEYYRGENKHY